MLLMFVSPVNQVLAGWSTGPSCWSTRPSCRSTGDTVSAECRLLVRLIEPLPGQPGTLTQNCAGFSFKSVQFCFPFRGRCPLGPHELTEQLDPCRGTPQTPLRSA
ncbi:hypothetical protein AAC387_Pa12g0545 [Persea americana]